MMCTAISYTINDHYFGRTLDYDHEYPCEIVITPRLFPFNFNSKPKQNNHYAIIGMAYISENYPLYFDAINEMGVGIAALNFPGNAVYHNYNPSKENVAQFEFIPWILTQVKSVSEARCLLKKTNITDTPFNKELQTAPLHWIISDINETITVESISDGLKIYDNPIGVLTNNPPFPMQMFNLNNYLSISAHPPQNKFSGKISLCEYSRGMGAIGLPGDLSSQSRFVRASFFKSNSISSLSEEVCVSQFFHILNMVEQPRGCCYTENKKCEITLYTSCCNCNKGIYYYTTYENRCISAIDLHHTELNSKRLITFPLIRKENIIFQN